MTKQKEKGTKSSWVVFAYAIIFTGFGIYLIIRNKYTIGIDHLTQKGTATSGHYFLLFGLIFFVVAYFTLSPYSKVRGFFENRRKTKKKKNKKPKS